MMTLDDTTQKNVNAWLEGNYDDASKSEVRRLLESDQNAVTDAFYRSLAFGTGGMRGVMGVGTNRINTYTIRAATQGLATYLKQCHPNQSLGVFIAYDSRKNSHTFALETARTLAANGIKAYVTKELRPTPLTSFGCRHYKCQAAVMITASHNPPEYNGYKVYWEDGAQVTPPHDKGIVDQVNAIKDASQIVVADLENDLIVEVGSDLDEAYYAAIEPLQIQATQNQASGSDLRVVYTNIHGTGGTMVPEALRRWGFGSAATVASQDTPDGNFPTVESPNPEEREALSLGIQQLLESEADLLLGTDPDADRVGIAVRHAGGAELLTGNQIACVCAEYVVTAMQSTNRLPSNGALVKTIVTSELLQEIADRNKLPCFNVLTGFKYIAELIRDWDTSGAHQFLFGGEESYGYLLGTHARDKDAVVSCALICEVALDAKLRGKTLVDCLHDLYEKYGEHQESVKSIKFPETKSGREQMESALAGLRASPPAEFGGERVVIIEDYLEGTKTLCGDGTVEALSLPKSNVLLYWLADGSKVVARPSGTEPKVKIYCGVRGGVEKVERYVAGIESLLRGQT